MFEKLLFNSVFKFLRDNYRPVSLPPICGKMFEKLLFNSVFKFLRDNYRPVSLPPICGKMFEKLLFNSVFKFPRDNNILSSNQSRFRPSDSCEYQLLSIVHGIYASFDCCPSLEVRRIFLDISH